MAETKENNEVKRATLTLSFEVQFLSIPPILDLFKTKLLGQWLNFKLVGITYLIGKKEFKVLFQGPGRLSELNIPTQRPFTTSMTGLLRLPIRAARYLDISSPRHLFFLLWLLQELGEHC